MFDRKGTRRNHWHGFTPLLRKHLTTLDKIIHGSINFCSSITCCQYPSTKEFFGPYHRVASQKLHPQSSFGLHIVRPGLMREDVESLSLQNDPIQNDY